MLRGVLGVRGRLCIEELEVEGESFMGVLGTMERGVLVERIFDSEEITALNLLVVDGVGVGIDELGLFGVKGTGAIAEAEVLVLDRGDFGGQPCERRITRPRRVDQGTYQGVRR